MIDREVMQMALDALEHLQTDIEWQYKSPTRAMLRKVEKELRARLAQGDPEPVAWALQQTLEVRIGTMPVAFKRDDEFGFVVPLYTTPPQQNDFNPDWDAIAVMVEEQQRMAKRIEELQGQLAQPEQEPVAWGVIQRGKGVWFVNDSRFAAQHYANHYSHRDAAGFDQKVVPLYTAPPQREWQGLTDEEIKTLAATSAAIRGSYVHSFARAIEAKLKEKNS